MGEGEFPDLDAFGTVAFGVLADRFGGVFSIYWAEGSTMDAGRLRLLMRAPYSGCVDVPVVRLDKQAFDGAVRYLSYHLERWTADDWRDLSFRFRPARDE